MVAGEAGWADVHMLRLRSMAGLRLTVVDTIAGMARMRMRGRMYSGEASLSSEPFTKCVTMISPSGEVLTNVEASLPFSHLDVISTMKPP